MVYRKLLLFILFSISIGLSLGVFINYAPDKHIYLGQSIGNADKYRELSKELYNYPGRVYVHIAGDGGNYEGVLYLRNLFKTIKHVTMVVEGTVQSGHALLAFAGNDIILPDYGFFMLHLSSGTNMAEHLCTSVKGLDRGRDSALKCLVNTKRVVDIYNTEVLNRIIPILTKKETELLQGGYEVYITSQEVKRRLESLQTSGDV